MLITKDLVFIHVQKTGGVFVERCLRRLYPLPSFPPYYIWRNLIIFIQNNIRFRLKPELKELISFENNALPMQQKISALARLEYFIFKRVVLPRHTGIYHLPRSLYYKMDRPKPIIFSIRNIFSREVSSFCYSLEEMKHYGLGIYPSLIKKFDKDFLIYKKYCGDIPFLELDFGNFLKYENEVKSRLAFSYYFSDMEIKHDLGFCALQLIYLLAPNPQTIIELPPSEFIDFFKNGGYKDWLKNVHVFHAENLNQELYQLLLQMGHPKRQIEFILSGKPVNISRASERKLAEFL